MLLIGRGENKHRRSFVVVAVETAPPSELTLTALGRSGPAGPAER